MKTLFRDHARPWLIGGLILIGLALIGALGARPVYQAYKVRRGLERAGKVARAMEANDLKEAAANLRMAITLAPGEPEVWRVAGRFCARVGNLDGLQYWQRLAQLPEFSLSERLEFAEFAQRLDRVDLVARQLPVLLASPKPDARVWRLAVLHQIRLGDQSNAAEAARRWLAQDPTDEEVQLILGETLLSHPDARMRAEGKGLVWGLALGNGRWSRMAVAGLASYLDLSRGELELLLRAGERRDASPALLTGLRLRLTPERRGEWMAALVSSGSTTNLARRLEAVAFLADHQETGLALELMPETIAGTDPRLRTARLQALLELGRTAEAEREMSALKPEDGIESHFRLCLEAQVAVKAGKSEQASRLLQQAVDACGNRPAPLRFCAVYAERLMMAPRVAMVAYQRLAGTPGNTVSAGREVLRIALALDDVVEARAALRQLSRFLAQDEGFLVGSAYMDLLVDARLGEDRLASVEQVLVRRPQDAFTRATVAFGRWRAGRLASALAALDEGGVDWEKAEPRCQAIQAAILGANLQREAARRTARGLPWERLLSAERQLVAEWR